MGKFIRKRLPGKIKHVPATCAKGKPLNNIRQCNSSPRRPIGIDLFAGAGGLSLGFEQAGFDIIYSVEHDNWAAQTYKNNNRKGVLVDTRNIVQISPRSVLKRLGLRKGELDIIIGGPPCQGFSTSNKKTRNLQNPNNHMVYKFVDFVRETKPKWFLMENVSGMNTFEDGRVRDFLLSTFRKLGYMTDYVILNSADFGVPQNRKRIFFIGNRVKAEMNFLKKLPTRSILKPVSVFDAISDLPHLKNGNGVDIMPYNARKRRLSKYQTTMRRKSNGLVKNNLATCHTNLAIKRFRHIRQGENLITLYKKNPALVANYSNINNCHHWIYLRLTWNKPSVTLINYRKNMLIHPVNDRGLSVREAARLQSFPDNYIFYGYLSSQQQQVSNAVPPLLSRVIAKKIIKYF